LKYLTGPKKTKSPKTMTDHLASAHNITADGQGEKQSELAQGVTGVVKVVGVKKWSSVDGRTANMVETIAKWFSIDGVAPNNVSKMGFKTAFEYLHPEFPGVSPPTIFERMKEYAAGLWSGFKNFSATSTGLLLRLTGGPTMRSTIIGLSQRIS
jgi:hypothetical protein